jgi:hypothetical protein
MVHSEKAQIMTPSIFFWYVLPFIIAAAAFGWMAYDYYVASPRRERAEKHPHPGE